MSAPEKVKMIARLTSQKMHELTASQEEWTAFLTTAARLYKYPFHEQLMIFAQRPNATACAPYDLWVHTMKRYVRRGSSGIGILDDSGASMKLRYVFDIADTGTRPNSRRLNVWTCQAKHENMLVDMLEHRYKIAREDNLVNMLEQTAACLAEEYWNNHQDDILSIVDDSFLYGYDELNVGVAFRNATTVSVAYALMSRCGLHPDAIFDQEDFQNIFEFNTPDAVSELGTAVSTINQEVLRQIEVTIKSYEREHHAERTMQHGERSDLHADRRLSDSQPESGRAAGEAFGQVRIDAKIVPEGTQTGSLQPAAAERKAVSSLSGDRGDSEPPSGRDDAAVGEGSRSDRSTESQRPDEVGGTDEHLQGTDRRDPDEGTYLQLTFNLFPSEAEQIQMVDKAENVRTSSAFSFAQSDIDHFLRYGGNTDRQRERVVAEFSKQKSVEENAAYLQSVFHGGNGITTENGNITAWYAEDGIHLSRTKSARYDRSAQVISWESAAERIGQLLEEGRFATNVELAEASGYERSRLAEKLLYLYRDLSGDAQKDFLLSLNENPAVGFHDEVAWISQKLTDPTFCAKLSEEHKGFMEAYSVDREILRFHYHRPKEIAAALADLELPRKSFETQMAELPAAKFFITEDEIDAALSEGSGFAGGKSRIYPFFLENHTTKEKVDFLKKEYGIGGRSHALSRATGSDECHDGKGVEYKKRIVPM